MAVEIDDLPVFGAAGAGLVKTLNRADAIFAGTTFSVDVDSGYRQAVAVVNATRLQFRALATLTLREIDAEIAEGDLVAGLTHLAQEAAEDAPQLKKVAGTISDVVAVLGKLTRVVIALPSLPFVSG